jgi:hypothetical protein
MEKWIFVIIRLMNRTDKIKRITLIFLGALASGYFMYSGFSLLMTEESTEVNASNGVIQLSK